MIKRICLLSLMTLLLVNFSFAQSDENRQVKIVIVEEEEVNGKVTRTEKTLTGDDAIKYMEENKEELGEDINIEIEESLDLKQEKDGSKEIKIVSKRNGEDKVMVWDGEGEMPAEMKDMIEDIDIDIDEISGEKKIQIKTRGGDRPMNDGDKMKKIERPEFKLKNGEDFGIKDDSNKARLGVKIKESDNAVYVEEVIPGSPAEKAGIAAGDQLVKVDDTEIDSIRRLLAEMDTLNKGDKINVVVKVGSKEKKIKVQL